MERAKVLFGCYRRGEANDPDQYVASIAAILTLYDVGLVRQVTDPRSGISTDPKFSAFMPNSGELKIYCDGIRDRRARMDHLGALPKLKRLPRHLDTTTPGRRANIFVPAGTPFYDRACKLAETADAADWRHDPDGRAGIWIALNLWEAPRMKPPSAPSELTVSSFLAAILRPIEPQEEAAE